MVFFADLSDGLFGELALMTESLSPALSSYTILLLGFFLALILSLFWVPFIGQWAQKANLLDAPGGRKIHIQPTPRLGGVGVFLAFYMAFGVLLLLEVNPFKGEGMTGLLVGSVLIFLVGFLDDLLDLPAPIKLFGQMMASLLAIALGMTIGVLDLPGSKLLVLNGWGWPFTLMWMIGLCNAVNFIDGVDGLAGGVSLLATVTLLVVALFTHQAEAALLACLLAGAIAGFLVYNFNPARIFLGDGGSLFIGFMLASIAVAGALKTSTVVMLAPLVALAVPIFDIVSSTLRRVLRGQSPFKADANHLHHRLLRLGLSPKQVVSVFYGLSFFLGLTVAVYIHSVGLYCLLMFGLSIFFSGLLFVLRQNKTPG